MFSSLELGSFKTQIYGHFTYSREKNRRMSAPINNLYHLLQLKLDNMARNQTL